MADALQAGDRVVVTHMDAPGREHWVNMSGTVVEVEDPAVDLFPVLVRLDTMSETYYFDVDELRLVVVAADLVAVANV